MQKRTSLCDLYKQTEEVIKKYEDMAFIELINSHLIPCCGGNPKTGRHAKKFFKIACKLYEQDKSNKLDKFK